MALADITASAVLSAIAEYDELGRELFLRTYGYEAARSYFLLHGGRRYDSKAICGVAHKYVDGRPLAPSDFSGGAAAVAKKLGELGFEVRSQTPPPWLWDELVLVCDLVVGHGLRVPPVTDPEVVALSELLRRLPLHPPEKRPAGSRSPHDVRAQAEILSALHPGRAAEGRQGSALELQVLEAFLADPERMRAAAENIRRGVLSGELTALPPLEEESEKDISAVEGRLLIRRHHARERDPRLRARKIEQVRAEDRPIACEACGFDFARTYGPRGRDYIEVHHVVPLHHTGERRTRLRDLALLCANCHRMVHVSRPWLTVEQLRETMAGQQRPGP